MNMVTLYWMGDTALSMIVLYLLISYVRLVAPRNRRMDYRYANAMVNALTRLGKWYAPVSLILVGLMANLMVLTGNCLTAAVVIISGIIASRVTYKAYMRLVG